MINSSLKANFIIFKRFQSTKIAIIGSGPSSFYTAHELIKKQPNLNISIFEKLPTPFGLSRYGISPDHNEVKNCEEILINLNEKSQINYYCNVEIGKDLKLSELKSKFNIIIMAYGASLEKKLNIKGENQAYLNGKLFSSKQIVDWYNGYPENHLRPPPFDKVKEVTIIGNGNVAMDIARILLMPLSKLSKTDITNHSYEILKSNKVEKINIIARRGILESSFSTREIRELLKLEEFGIKFEGIKGQDLTLIKLVKNKFDRILKRKLDILMEFNSKPKPYQIPNKFNKFWNLQYLKSPIEILSSSDQIEIKFVKNVIKQNSPIESTSNIEQTNEYEIHKPDLLITSLGYLGEPLPEFKDLNINFQDGLIKNDNFKILDLNNKPIDGFYVIGWLNSQSKGPILNQVLNSSKLSEIILKDIKDGKINQIDDNEVDFKINNKKILNWQDWEKLNKFELEFGKENNKLRWKVPKIDQMIKIIKSDDNKELNELKNELKEYK
ncbi:hypothetical protein WICMUC_005639 [Wickerhamomyces mucosus]|uniref:NADPH:adrenodoxin oxidoreductase, mitochondrial n=1 Tax=Wickerhamomyces mucosus TaxID=1378264 RepID=A0A9P8P7C6_9ASCO|nr:hypothetical protein WICMUC_005639 [Wickerhamomyces mucosus]